jgi:hypothetical protein
VFQVVRDSKCSECGTEIEQDDLLTMEGAQALCMACAGLSDLEFLEAGHRADAPRHEIQPAYSRRRALQPRAQTL